MNRDEFWYLIEKGNKEKTEEKKLTLWTAVLARSQDEDIFTFYDIMHTYFRLADQERLLAAANIIFTDCSDDAFDGFRAWLIAQGENAYFSVLAEPEYLIELCNPGQTHRMDKLLQVPYEAFFQKNGTPEDYRGFSLAQEYLGLTPIQKNLLEEEITFAWDIREPWEPEELPFLFPRLYEKFN